MCSCYWCLIAGFWLFHIMEQSENDSLQNPGQPTFKILSGIHTGDTKKSSSSSRNPLVASDSEESTKYIDSGISRDHSETTVFDDYDHQENSKTLLKINILDEKTQTSMRCSPPSDPGTPKLPQDDDEQAQINQQPDSNDDLTPTSLSSISDDTRNDWLNLQDTRYECHHCRIVYMGPSVYDIHMQAHGRVHPFVCVCGVDCRVENSQDTILEFNKHLKLMPHLPNHLQLSRPSAEEQTHPETTNTSDDDSEPPSKKIRLNEPSTSEEHDAATPGSPEPSTSSECPRRNWDLRRPSWERQNDLFQCSLCGILYRNYDIQNLHVLAHATADTFECACGQYCDDKNAFNLHLFHDRH